jgi:hypothetical protein
MRNGMRKFLLLLAGAGALLAATPLPAAAEAKGCDGFLWPLATELAWMKADSSEKIASGATLPAPPADKAIELALLPVAQVSFPAPPTGTPKPGDTETFGGVVTFEPLADAAHFQVTLSGPGWIDVVQDGKSLEATGHTGSKDCDGLRKSVRFEVAPGPFAIQVSGVPKDSMRIAIRPAAD